MSWVSEKMSIRALHRWINCELDYSVPVVMFLSLCGCVCRPGLGNVVCLLEDAGNLKLDIVSLAIPKQRVQVG